MIDLIAAAGIGGIIGAGIMAWRTHGMVSSLQYYRNETGRLAAECRSLESELGETEAMEEEARRIGIEAKAAHTRCADALTTKERKLSAIRDLLDKPRTIRKGELAMILDGERV